ncbi:Os09g0335100 [Oryza sativa Japonica Group]|uniref:Os09g0335100 protein n=1 Tax=Oryza sativa subsp. japonica TaxID=39947 RepID=A0A0P0XLL6_ORYSJ|nr:Os09g0335100 [Oryza sativa Japonica Group]
METPNIHKSASKNTQIWKEENDTDGDDAQIWQPMNHRWEVVRRAIVEAAHYLLGPVERRPPATVEATGCRRDRPPRPHSWEAACDIREPTYRSLLWRLRPRRLSGEEREAWAGTAKADLVALAVRDDEGEVLREMVVRAFEEAVDIVKEEEVVVVGRMETARAGTSVGARSGLGITVRTKEEENG